MRFDVYGLYQLQVIRRDDRWLIYRLDIGKRRAFADFAIPASLPPEEIAVFLDDMLHEMARPGAEIRRVD